MEDESFSGSMRRLGADCSATIAAGPSYQNQQRAVFRFLWGKKNSPLWGKAGCVRDQSKDYPQRRGLEMADG